MSFDFGFGPVSAHRHTNGGGWVADTAIVEATAFVGPEALVCGEARVYGEAHVYDKAQVCGKALVCHTPVLISGYEFSLTILDSQVQIGCKTVKSAEDLTPDIFPEESCPRLRSAAPNIIPLVLAHWACCKTGWTTLPLPDDDDDDE